MRPRPRHLIGRGVGVRLVRAAHADARDFAARPLTRVSPAQGTPRQLEIRDFFRSNVNYFRERGRATQ